MNLISLDESIMRIAFGKRSVTWSRYLHYQTRERYLVTDMSAVHPIGIQTVSNLRSLPLLCNGSTPHFGEFTRHLEICHTSKIDFFVLSSTSAHSFSFCRVSVAKQTCNAISNGMLYVQCSAAINNPSLHWQGPKGSWRRLRSTHDF